MLREQDGQFAGGGSRLDAHAVASLLLQSGQSVDIQVTGSSMAPSIPRDALLRLRAADGPLRAGQVVTFRSEGALLTHRVISVVGAGSTREYAVTRGDGTSIADYPVARENVVGVAHEFFDGTTWRTIPPPSPRPGWRARAATIVSMLAHALLVIDVRLARAVIFVARRVSWLFLRSPGN